MFHEQEIIRWAKCPDKTGVWWKNCENEWILVDSPMWRKNKIYIVDDEWAEYRKSQIDGKIIECYQGDYYPLEQCNQKARDFKLSPADDYYRIKPEEPVYEWQWMYYNYVLKKYDITDTFYTTSKEAQEELNIFTDRCTVIEKYKPSKRIRK